MVQRKADACDEFQATTSPLSLVEMAVRTKRPWISFGSSDLCDQTPSSPFFYYLLPLLSQLVVNNLTVSEMR